MEKLRRRIETWLSGHEPGSRLGRVRALNGGVSSRMTAFDVSRVGEARTLVLRQPNDWTIANRHESVTKEFNLLRTLHRSGLRVPNPVFLDESDVHFGRPGLVMEYIEGHPEFRPDDLPDFLEQYARQLAEIHNYGGAIEDLALPGPSTLGFRPDYYREKPLADPAFQVDRIWSILAANEDRRSNNPPVLQHGDFWPGNVLWREGSLVAVIDWEEAAYGDPLRDLSISRLDLCWVFGRQTMQDFTERYLAIRPVDVSLLPLWDLGTALRPVMNLNEWAANYPPFGRPDVTVDHMMQVHSEYVAEALSALDRLTR